VTSRVTLTIPGEPRGWGRPTPVAKLRGDGTPFVMMVTQDETRAAKNALRRLFKAKYPGHRPWAGPVMLRFTAVFETPASFNKALKEAADRGKLYCVKKPDTDNIAKLIKDALNGLVYCDDQQVMGGGVKRDGSPARVEIDFESLETADVPATPGQRRAERALTAGPAKASPRPLQSKPTKSQSQAPEKAPPDLSGYNDRQKDLIERALARDAVAQVKRQKAAGRGQ
jgi:Holliday junction resolvase RusA-like endonuclease